MTPNDPIAAWIACQIRSARHLAHTSGRSVESALLRMQWARVNEIRVLFPWSSVAFLLSGLLATFDALPDEEKTPLPDDTGWTEEASSWARARLEQGRHAVHAEGYEFPATLLTPELFTEAAERFPSQDMDGCLFSTAFLLAYEGRENAEQAALFPAQTVPAHPTHPTGMVVRALYSAALRGQDPEYTARDAVRDIAHDLRIDEDMTDPETVLVLRWVLDYSARAADFRGAPDAGERVASLAAAAPETFLRDTGKEPPEDLGSRVERAAHQLLRK